MGQLVVGLAGAAVGSAFGNPALGFTAGTFLGGLLFPPDPIRIEGPRREDLRVSSSTYGRPIPEGFGVIRMPGNMIWSSGIREIQTTQEVGGKGGLGGPSQEQVSYTYFVDASFAFAQGPAQAILRIWADGKVIYDIRDPNTTGAVLQATTKPGITVRTYLGTETQLPCPTIQATEGVANTPAFRGTVYLTLESFALADYGNRIPQITAEVAFKATGSDGGRLSSDQEPKGTPEGVRADYTRNQFVLAESHGDFSGIHIWSMTSLSEYRRQPVADIGLQGDSLTNATYYIDQNDGGIYIQTQNNHGAVHVVDPDTLTVVSQFGQNDAGSFDHILNNNMVPADQRVAYLDWMMTAQCFATGAVPEGLTTKTFILGFSQVTDAPAIIDVSDRAHPLWIGFDNAPGYPAGTVIGVSEPAQADTAVMWVIHGGGTNNDLIVWKWEIDFNAHLDVANDQIIGLRQFQAKTFTAAEYWDSDGTSGGPSVVYDHTDGNLIFRKNVVTGSRTAMWKWDQDNDVVKWCRKGSDAIASSNQGSANWSQYSRVTNGTIGVARGAGNGDYAIVDTLTGLDITVLDNMNAIFSDWIGDDDVIWDSIYSVFTSEHFPLSSSTLEQYFVGRKTGLGESLSSVMTEFSGDNVNGAGLTGSQFDTTQLVNDTVRGYAVTRQMSIKKAVEPLFTAYDFDATEVDDKMLFVKRGGASVANITQADIVAAAQIVVETRTQEIEIPERLDLGYIDQDQDYQENLATAKQPRAPVATMYSSDNKTLDLAIVFTATEAKGIAERLLFTAWQQRQKLAFSLSDEFIGIVSTDIVTLTLDSGTVFKLRIVKESIGVNHTQQYEGVIVYSSISTISTISTADASLGFEEDLLPTSLNTRLFLIDSPYLRDVDSTVRETIELKFAMAGFAPGWQAGTLFDSADGLAFLPAAQTNSAVEYGVVSNALSTGFVNLTDTTTVLNVSMIEGSLSSVTEAEFLANEQVAIIGSPITQNWEIVAFRDAVQQASGNYSVSRLMRGRRGTDAPIFTDGHGGGEIFIVASRANVERILLVLGQHNVVRYYRGVGRDDLLESSTTVPLVSKARPLMPVQLYRVDATVDGSDNIDLSWERGSRLYFELSNAASWQDSSLEEDSEEYELDIYDDAAGTTLLRAVTALTVKSYEWTKANIATDLGVNNATAQIDVGSTSTFTQASGSFITDGFLAGMKIETAAFTDAANNGVFTVSNVAALTLTIEETTLVVETGTGDETIDAIRQSAVYVEGFQISAQVGRGFGTGILTIPL